MHPIAATPAEPPLAAALGTPLQVLLIQVGHQSFGLPLAEVRYVAAVPADFRSHGAGAAEYFPFEGEPLSYFPLWDLLGVVSRYAEYEDMQAMLPQRRQDHLDWMAALESSIRSGAAFAKARNPRECAFGKWFYAYRSQDRRLSMLLDQFEQPHATIHALADSLLGLVESGRGGEALESFTEHRNTTLARLLQLFQSAQDLVQELQRRIAVIVADGTRRCALGADQVLDIVDIPAERLRLDMGSRRQGAAGITSGLAILEDQSIVPMLDWRQRCQAQ